MHAALVAQLAITLIVEHCPVALPAGLHEELEAQVRPEARAAAVLQPQRQRQDVALGQGEVRELKAQAGLAARRCLGGEQHTPPAVALRAGALYRPPGEGFVDQPAGEAPRRAGKERGMDATQPWVEPDERARPVAGIELLHPAGTGTCLEARDAGQLAAPWNQHQPE